MFNRAVTFFYFVLSLSILAVAMPGGSPTSAPASSPTGSSCSTGPVQCCNSAEDVRARPSPRPSFSYFRHGASLTTFYLPPLRTQSNSAAASLLLGLLGIVLGDITGLIGLDCSPINVVGIGSGNACSANAVCCTNNNVVRLPEPSQPFSSSFRVLIALQGGLISIGCVPIIL